MKNDNFIRLLIDLRKEFNDGTFDIGQAFVKYIVPFSKEFNKIQFFLILSEFKKNKISTYDIVEEAKNLAIKNKMVFGNNISIEFVEFFKNHIYSELSVLFLLFDFDDDNIIKYILDNSWYKYTLVRLGYFIKRKDNQSDYYKWVEYHINKSKDLDELKVFLDVGWPEEVYDMITKKFKILKLIKHGIIPFDRIVNNRNRIKDNTMKEIIFALGNKSLPQKYFLDFWKMTPYTYRSLLIKKSNLSDEFIRNNLSEIFPGGVADIDLLYSLIKHHDVSRETLKEMLKYTDEPKEIVRAYYREKNKN